MQRNAPNPRETTLIGVNILRGVAALAVVVHHGLEEGIELFPSLGGAVAIAARAGAAGVDIFFVISGFIMLHTSWNSFGQRGTVGNFLARRLIRIAPLYWLCILAVLVMWASGYFYKSRTFSLTDVGLSLAFLPTSNLVHGVGWTLGYEMYFYALFAVLLAAGRRSVVVLALPVALAAGLVLSQLLPPSATRTFLANPIVLEFAYGIALAAMWNSRPNWPISPRWLLAIGTGFIVAASAIAPSDGTAGVASSIRFLVWGLPALMIVAAMLPVQDVQSRLARGLHWLGDRSYSLYLTHAFVMTAYAVALKAGVFRGVIGGMAGLVVVTVLSVLLAAVVYRLIERPTNIWLRDLWSSRRAHPSKSRAAGTIA